MKHLTINGRPIGPQPARQLVSRSAILILSGVLIGTTLNQPELTGTAFSGFCAGIVGMISFVALDLAAQRRQSQAVRKTLASADSMLIGRLHRHVSFEGPLAPRPRKPHAHPDASYLPVATADAGTRR